MIGCCGCRCSDTPSACDLQHVAQSYWTTYTFRIHAPCQENEEDDEQYHDEELQDDDDEEIEEDDDEKEEDNKGNDKPEN